MAGLAEIRADRNDPAENDRQSLQGDQGRISTVHEDYYSKLMNLFHPPSWSEIFAQCIAIVLFISLNLFVNIVVGVSIGAVTCWLFSHCFVGPWISSGFNMLGANVPETDLYALCLLYTS